ncbi:polysaccharide biosynthesis/export family protein [Desulfobacter latus]|uniref:Polysaccharide biosynthesis/export family protein n=1 Tax=Desulfobacter latus TaxID=2292 RepID=A0A850T0U0_9BACT|nr:polysaccharide biosynthesis/export family protein [Desulfobacter latus]NWH04701.1 polysaccharide biosynthesis/export family protein [Desulfobacter latus]
MQKKSISVVYLLIIIILCSCSTGRHKPLDHEVGLDSSTFSFDADTYPTSDNLFPHYQMAPGDIIDVLFQIQTWREKNEFLIAIDHTLSVKFVNSPELNETQRIQPDGKISLPYLGEVYVVNKTVIALTEYLTQRYSKILRDPLIYVTVPEFRSRIKELKKDLHTAPRGLSRLVMVRPDGYTTFPLLGDIFVAHKTFPEVKETLNKLYDSVLPGLHVDLFLEKHSGSVIYIMGEVNTPGTYNVMKPISIMQALAMGGGFKSSSKLEEVIVFRRLKNKLVANAVNVQDTLYPDDASTFFYLKPDDIVFVPKNQRSALAEAHREIADILFFRGWSIGLDGTIYKPPILGPDD